MPEDMVQRLSLKHHLSLVALRQGKGTLETFVTLKNVLEVTHRLEAHQDRDPHHSNRAELALAQCFSRVERGDPWMLSEEEAILMEPILLAHDDQLATLPTYRYLDVLEHSPNCTKHG
ncbi:hypothetical protein [Burkholderia vietnamiensis]|uniref:hypothetical protein n=1 Tax=Burkholderia vietnamiensis TaxID=60552 RepID=UPI00159405CD|nr:hypothetical protein [Burkholderia vietnamiensis]